MSVTQKYLLQTDQIECYTSDGLPISCNGTGQDGAFPKQRRLPRGQRFQRRDPVVRDLLTGAVWTRDANPAQLPLSWQEAQAFVTGLRAEHAFGYDDWQLPSRRLLFTLLSHQRIEPALPEGHPFENVFSGYYWSGDSCRRLADQAWYVHLGGGRVHRGMKHGSYLVWPVSMREAAVTDARTFEERFAIQAACVHDTCTGLSWSRDAAPLERSVNWDQALTAVKTFNQTGWGGYGDWRLPNIRELESLVSLDMHSPALAAGHPFVNIRDAYWSSTTSVYEPRYAWALYSQDGVVGVAFKRAKDFHFWPVRG